MIFIKLGISFISYSKRCLSKQPHRAMAENGGSLAATS